ncbi:hypothetical protein OXPF_14920 [Oxobacter pfennigii]|uniref:DUF3824 domain-containing protein n=1 Tax=Oxobacter pfennigii TaxID=36849 RepID=A0A0P8X2H8_9CLOT|nr:DUF3824 domain-containing protein [Oxobacter pfennigii]KPU45014.1 hypothetical protein OXPF_14920 [Oxobacter pfennigii]
MNLGALFADNNTNNNNTGIFGNNRTIWIMLLIALVVFGFGNGLKGDGAFGGGAPFAYEEYEGYRNESRKEKKRKKKHRKHRDEREYEEAYQNDQSQAPFIPPFNLDDSTPLQ